MDMKVEIKEEPVWLEGTANTSLGNFELVPEVISLKQEIRSELTEPGPAQENTFEPSPDVKKEVFIGQPTVEQLVPFIKEENKVENPLDVFSCSICGKDFGTRRKQRRHIKTHSDDRPFSCTMCGMTFIRAYNLRKHTNTHTDARPFSCSICGKNFKSAWELRTHSVVHTDSKPYCCTICEKTLKTKCNLKKHAKVHTDITAFLCPVCKRCFKTDGELRKHHIIHSVIKLPSCCI